MNNFADQKTRPAGEPGNRLPPFRIVQPENHTVPFVINSPHSGSYYPPSFLAASKLDGFAIRRSEDVMVDELYAPLVALGMPLLNAVYPRAYIDMNREPYELDPKMFTERLPAYANSRSLRVAGGLGTVPRIVADSQEIYTRPITVQEAIERIENIYRPYHDGLRNLLARTRVAFGIAFLIDCHSMPSSPRGSDRNVRPDIVLGDRFGSSCEPEFARMLAKLLRESGYTVSRNKPYAGGFITEHYGRPNRGLHALQIEVNRSLYMDETSLQIHEGFARLQNDLKRTFSDMMDFTRGLADPLRDAAE